MCMRVAIFTGMRLEVAMRFMRTSRLSNFTTIGILHYKFSKNSSCQTLCNNILVNLDTYQNWLKIEIVGYFIHSIIQIIFFTREIIFRFQFSCQCEFTSFTCQVSTVILKIFGKRWRQFYIKF